MYPQMREEAREEGWRAKEAGLPRECNLVDSKFVHKGKALSVYAEAWYQGYDDRSPWRI